MNQITCTKCGISKDPKSFRKDRTRSTGRRSYCKSCYNAQRCTRSRDHREVVTRKFVNLPHPEDLPASYMKQVSDYWIALVGGEQPTRRIL